MKRVCSSKKSAAPYPVSGRLTPQERSHQPHRHANLKTRFTHHVHNFPHCIQSEFRFSDHNSPSLDPIQAVLINSFQFRPISLSAYLKICQVASCVTFFPTKNVVSIPHASCYASPQSNHHSFGKSNNIWWKHQITRLYMQHTLLPVKLFLLLPNWYFCLTRSHTHPFQGACRQIRPTASHFVHI